jgi:hypothetical protein
MLTPVLTRVVNLADDGESFEYSYYHPEIA